MKATRGLESALTGALFAGSSALSWRGALAAGAGLGDVAHALGLRRRVAEQNLSAAFPDWSTERRARVVRDVYRELGRVALEYPRLDRLAAAPLGEHIAAIEGREHLERAIRDGRGAILMGGHFGNFELSGACMARLHPTSFVVRPLANPGVETRIRTLRARAGIGQIQESAPRAVYEALRANQWVAMLADQDARRHGVFVPFFGRPASTAIGPARIALATGAPIIMGLMWREPDGRHRLEVDPPLRLEDPGAPDAALRLTALHVRRLEERVREHPEQWFWLHRRWKTAPVPGTETVASAEAAGAEDARLALGKDG